MNGTGNDENISAETVPLFTYFIRDGDAIKIGKSMAPVLRMQNLQSSSPRPMKMLAMVPATVASEPECHQRFEHLHIRGEWFRAEPDLLAFVRQMKAAQPRARKRPNLDRRKQISKEVGNLQKLQAQHCGEMAITEPLNIIIGCLREFEGADHERRIGMVQNIKAAREHLAGHGIHV